ncbi:unnamed protein product [Mytilus edulis]|uniref:Uncharacterized protein n=1 Tax=Mytilus edulis TaxID=6550 RepID=A0A8S3VS07_MYTED|nr:unnamed protein product [Mytilus edulis]
MNISIWFNNTTPAYSWQIMKQNILTYSQCDFNTDFGTAGFSLTTCYKIEDLSVERQYRVSLRVRICFESTPLNCMIDFNVFDNSLVPKKQCSWNAGFSDPDCDVDVTFPSPPSIPSSAMCSLHSSCTSVDCCVNIDFLQRGFRASVDLDPCTHVLTFSIERLQEQISLNGFTITEQPLQYEIDLDMSLCFEYGGACYFTMTVFKHTILPKQFSHIVSRDFFLFTEFSLSQFLLDQGQAMVSPLPSGISITLLTTLKVTEFLQGTPCSHSVYPYTLTNGRFNNGFSILGWLGETYENKDTLDPYVVNELMRDLQLIDYLMEPQCNVSTAPYTPVNGQGWNISPGCTTAPTLSTLTSEEVTCNLGDSCTSIKCCVTSVKLGRTFTVDLDLDVCNQTFMVGVDRLTRTVALASFVFSQEDVFSFDGLINVRYMAQEITAENVYQFTVNVSMCFESAGDCHYEYTVFDNTKIPIPPCNWTETEHNVPGCFTPVTLASLDDSTITCNLDSSCRAIECCLDVPVIKKSAHIFMNLDTCNYQLRVGIEKHQFNITLRDYQFGEWTIVDLNGVFRMNFIIHDLYAENEYLISLNISVCFEQNSCHLVYDVFNNVRLPRPTYCTETITSLRKLDNTTTCHLLSTCTGIECCSTSDSLGLTLNSYVYIDPCNYRLSIGIEQIQLNYSLVDYNWGEWIHYSLYDVYNLDFVAEDLIGDEQYVISLNISICLESSGPCEVALVIFDNDRLSKPTCDWNTEFIIPDCTSAMDPLPAIVGEANCHIASHCTGVYCCLYNPRMARSFETRVNFEPCLFKLTVSIEELTFDILLSDYVWTEPTDVWLFGFVRMDRRRSLYTTVGSRWNNGSIEEVNLPNTKKTRKELVVDEITTVEEGKVEITPTGFVTVVKEGQTGGKITLRGKRSGKKGLTSQRKRK